MITDEQRLQEAQVRAFARMKPFKLRQSIPCEYAGCTCPRKEGIYPGTMSVIVTPSLDIELVCQQGAEDFARKQGAILSASNQ